MKYGIKNIDKIDLLRNEQISKIINKILFFFFSKLFTLSIFYKIKLLGIKVPSSLNFLFKAA